MRIVEVREGYIKFESSNTLPVSSFIQVDDTARKYVAQILQCKNVGNVWICYAKIQFLFDGELISYDKKTSPSKDSVITLFPFEVISRNFDNINPLVVGNFSDGSSIVVDKNIFDKNVIVSIDSPDNNKLFVSNMLKQFNKSLVIDMLGIYNDTEKFVAGVDFKLPLNTASLEFMFQDCLNDATTDSKSLIKEIFQDLSGYSQTVKFVPFSVLKSIVDDMVNKEHVFKLLVLKNKLAKFEQLGYFASTINEVNKLEEILSNKTSVIDLSKLDSIFQNRYLTIILDMVKSQAKTVQVVLETSNSINKQNLKRVFTDEDLSITFVTHSRFKYINELKTVVDNFVVESNSANKEIFKPCKPLLDSLSSKEFLLLGKSICGLALASTFEELVISEKVIVEDVKEPSQVTVETESVVNENEEKSLTQEEIEELENSLNEDSSNEADEVYEGEEISAINKKSEELIQKVAEEVVMEEVSENIFAEDDEVLELEDAEEQPQVESDSDEIEVSEQENIVEDLELNESIDEEIKEIEAEVVIAETEESITEVELEDSLDSEGNLEDSTEIIEESLEEGDLELEPAGNENPEEDDFKTEVDEIHAIEIPKDISDMADDNLELIETPEVSELNSDEPEELLEDNNLHTDDIGFKDYTDEAEYIAPTPNSSNDLLEEEFDEIVELDESEISDDDILVDIDDEIEILDEDSLDKQIVEDVDKVFTTMKDDSISDSDLDFIDELNSSVESEELVLGEGIEELSDFTGFEDSEEEGFIEPLEELSDLNSVEEEKEILETKQGSTPIVPVYGAEIPPEDVVMSDPIEQGDTVNHAKYGIGVVEKMIKYGTKTLYSINFDNVGRRLLDPTLTEIKKS